MKKVQYCSLQSQQALASKIPHLNRKEAPKQIRPPMSHMSSRSQKPRKNFLQDLLLNSSSIKLRHNINNRPLSIQELVAEAANIIIVPPRKIINFTKMPSSSNYLSQSTVSLHMKCHLQYRI